ncbi:hypothetical protein A2450_01995 [candidate division WWE3 bacterium RIFOXYC2_FULL_40_11]|nr:MAG: hypothetical protein A2450_01995 [candidate division WWE3 bacterium RIFOXYC2_FULL_40_11]
MPLVISLITALISGGELFFEWAYDGWVATITWANPTFKIFSVSTGACVILLVASYIVFSFLYDGKSGVVK